MQRRTFLATVGAGTIGTLAGCQTAVGAVAPPSVPQDKLDDGGWTLREETNDETVFEQEYSVVTVEAVATSRTYADAALRDQVRTDTLGTVDTDLALFSATRVDIAPAVDELGPVQSEAKSRIREHATAQLRDQLEAAGIEDVEETGTDTLSVAGGHEADLVELQGNYPVSDISFPVQADTSITIEGGELPIAALLAVWAADGNYLIAGGAYPAANFTRNSQSQLSDAISVTIDVDLGLTPAAYREELLGLVTAVR
jgi:hypothetical protein